MAQLLVIEDESDIRTQLLKVLKYEDFDVISAANGRKGIALARSQLPDLVLCDISMPEGNGYDVLHALRTDPATAAIPFIFLTAKSGEQAVRKGMQSGADDYLTKPFQINDLLTSIRARLEKYRAVKQQSAQQFAELRMDLSSALPHELQTPLTGIMGYAQLLIGFGPERLPSAEKILTFQEEILSNAVRLQHLIENYLLYTQIVLKHSGPDAEKIWEDSIGIYSPKIILNWVIGEKGKIYQRTADFILAVEEGDVRMSDILFRKICSELIDNACKFSELGSPIRITTTINAGQFTLIVEDRGRGMSQDQIDRIEAFQQFDRRLHEQQGSGLGLIISKLLAEQYHGECRLESRQGEGTKVTATFPLSQ